MPRTCVVTRVLVTTVEIDDDEQDPGLAAHKIADSLPADTWDVVDQEVEFDR